MPCLSVSSLFLSLLLLVTAARAQTSAPANPPGPFLISGTISALAADSITVTQRNQPTTIAINAATVIRLDLKLAPLADLKLGQAVGIWGTTGNPAVEIRAYTPQVKPPTTQPTTKPTTQPTTQPAATNPGPFLISGTITAAAADSLTVKQNATSMTITIVSTTVIKLDNAVTTADALKVGQAVGVFATAGKPAVEIRAFTPKPKSGS